MQLEEPWLTGTLISETENNAKELIKTEILFKALFANENLKYMLAKIAHQTRALFKNITH